MSWIVSDAENKIFLTNEPIDILTIGINLSNLIKKTEESNY